MTDETYDVYFSGAIIKDSDPAEVKRKIGAVFKLQGDKLDRLFSGEPIPIKKGIDMDRAIKFRVTFRDAGGLVDIVPSGAPAPTAKPSPSPRPREASRVVAAQAPSGSSELTFASGPMEAAADDSDITPIAVPDYELSSAQDFDLSDCAPEVEAAEIPDISAMDMDKPGIIIDESPQPEPLEIDTSALDLDQPGVTLIEETPPEPPEIDTTALTVSPPNQGSLEDCQSPVEPAPIPNIDHLDVVEAKPDSPRGKAKFKISEE
jgi:hypothetical protein